MHAFEGGCCVTSPSSPAAADIYLYRCTVEDRTSSSDILYNTISCQKYSELLLQTSDIVSDIEMKRNDTTEDQRCSLTGPKVPVRVMTDD